MLFSLDSINRRHMEYLPYPDLNFEEDLTESKR